MAVRAYGALLDGILAARDAGALRRAHGRLVAVGLAPHPFLRCKLLSAYAACSRPAEAHLLLSFLSSSHRRPPLFALNSLLRSSPSASASLRLFRRMLLLGPGPDARSFAAALSSAAPSLRLARLLHAAALVAGLLRDPVLPPSLISAYSRGGDLASARRVLDETPQRGRTLAAWTAMIAACGAHGRAAEAVEIFEREAAGGGDAAAATAVLAACARAGMVAAARRVFARLGRPALQHYTCMVDVLGRAGLVEEAEALIAGMETEPDDALWATLLGACRMHARLDVAERVANRVYGLKLA
ncbi:pentatricopeptide repeat-containing protein At2g33760-like [Ananas comosus]|uniref:Pentatricopeptide repeat-containing protein n=1 Tax=Ananas comosus TaxID=4615 RepID=A0A199W645_ANACO|nr:pentatricopeptide repeat-containing protein At2g33760-like [Ananas comosus]OAY84663.1 Pentatricopeptide repeat-containing protein [Ananas comosus]